MIVVILSGVMNGRGRTIPRALARNRNLNEAKNRIPDKANPRSLDETNPVAWMKRTPVGLTSQ
jgi:hypothetical protein